MSVTLKPIIGCNLGCNSCYETRIFQANGNKPEAYNLQAVIDKMLMIPGGVTLHGGEILLMPLPDLRALMQAARDDGRQISVQTNATMISDEHIVLFRECHAGIGVSLNGPAELNRDRRAIPHTSRQLPILEGNDITDKMTERVHRAIFQLRDAEVPVSIICVLSKTNAGDATKLERLIKWAAEMGEAHGVWNIRFNVLHDDYSDGANIELTETEATNAYLTLAHAALSDKDRKWLPFREYVDNVEGLGCQPCWHGGCDTYQTAAVHAVFGDGSEGNCLRTAKDGVTYVRDIQTIDMRGQILQQTPKEFGGCKGCRHWRVCKGACPAEAIDGDWRNRSRFCQMYYQTYEWLIDLRQAIEPNWTPCQDWTTNDEPALINSINNRKPLVSSRNPMDPNWSVMPSSWRQDARTQK